MMGTMYGVDRRQYYLRLKAATFPKLHPLVLRVEYRIAKYGVLRTL